MSIRNSCSPGAIAAMRIVPAGELQHGVVLDRGGRGGQCQKRQLGADVEAHQRASRQLDLAAGVGVRQQRVPGKHGAVDLDRFLERNESGSPTARRTFSSPSRCITRAKSPLAYSSPYESGSDWARAGPEAIARIARIDPGSPRRARSFSSFRSSHPPPIRGSLPRSACSMCASGESRQNPPSRLSAPPATVLPRPVTVLPR